MGSAVAGTHFISAEECLRSVYRLDVDYIDGRLQSRNAGQYDHASLQAALLVYFHAHRVGWNLRVVQEQRLRISENRYRVPDTCLFCRDLSVEQVFARPPLVCIEVLSPEDRIKRFQAGKADLLHHGRTGHLDHRPSRLERSSMLVQPFCGLASAKHLHPGRHPDPPGSRLSLCRSRLAAAPAHPKGIKRVTTCPSAAGTILPPIESPLTHTQVRFDETHGSFSNVHHPSTKADTAIRQNPHGQGGQ